MLEVMITLDDVVGTNSSHQWLAQAYISWSGSRCADVEHAGGPKKATAKQDSDKVGGEAVV